MKHLEFSPTPISKLDYLSSLLDNNIYMKREDLFDSGGGGSKARMLQYILHKAIRDKHDCIVTAGGPYSNFNRALALLCGKYNLKMYLVLYDKNSHINKMSLNKRVCDYCEVQYVYSTPEKVAETLNEIIMELKKNNNNPYFIWGGGKSVEGVYAYYDCIREIANQTHPYPDYIIVPVGTGTTYTGLLVGCKMLLPDTQVIGISVARKEKEAKVVIEELIYEFSRYCNDDSIKESTARIRVLDDYLDGGYGKLSREGQNFIKEIIIHEGLIIDEIYVGKAMFGLSKLIKEKLNIRNKNIMFMNTGGVYNF